MSARKLHKMSSSDNVETRAVIRFCTNLGKTPTETTNMMQQVNKDKPGACRLLVFKWHKLFRGGRETIEDD